MKPSLTTQFVTAPEWSHAALVAIGMYHPTGGPVHPEHVFTLADALSQTGTAAERAASMTFDEWKRLAARIGTEPPSQRTVEAVLDALHRAGVKEFEMPASPQRLWSALQAARR